MKILRPSVALRKSKARAASLLGVRTCWGSMAPPEPSHHFSSRLSSDEGARAEVSSIKWNCGAPLALGVMPPRLAGRGFGDGGGGDEGEFDAAAHGVDALGADADTVAEFPGHCSDLLV